MSLRRRDADQGSGGRVVVEFCGIPGSGKSFIAAKMVERCNALGYPATLSLEPIGPRVSSRTRLLRKVALAGACLARRPVVTTRSVRAVWRSQNNSRDRMHRSFNWIVLTQVFVRAGRLRGIHVVDQGWVQELCSVGHAGDWSSLVSLAPYKGIEHSHIVVVVTADLDNSVARLSARPGRQSRLEHSDPAELMTELMLHQLLLQDVVDRWLLVPGHDATVFEIANDESLTDRRVARRRRAAHRESGSRTAPLRWDRLTRLSSFVPSTKVVKNGQRTTPAEACSPIDIRARRSWRVSWPSCLVCRARSPRSKPGPLRSCRGSAASERAPRPVVAANS